MTPDLVPNASLVHVTTAGVRLWGRVRGVYLVDAREPGINAYVTQRPDVTSGRPRRWRWEIATATAAAAQHHPDGGVQLHQLHHWLRHRRLAFISNVASVTIADFLDTRVEAFRGMVNERNGRVRWSSPTLHGLYGIKTASVRILQHDCILSVLKVPKNNQCCVIFNYS